MQIWSTLSNQLRDGNICVLVTVFESNGSAPREAGARMIVCAGDGFFGTIGGGALEWQAIGHARSLIEDESSGFQLRKFALGPELGQCCGGHVSLGFEPMRPSALPAAERLADLETRRQTFATRGTIRDDGAVDRTVLHEATPDYGPSFVDNGGQPALVEPSGTLLERFGTWRRPLYLFGAGHVARALVLALAQHPFSVRWIDSREDAFPRHFPPNTTPYRIENPATALNSAARDAFVVVMTHSHKLDEEIISGALAKGRFFYVGLIGSDTKKARFLKRLRVRGHSQSTINRLICPIGITGIRSKTPAAIATSVAAQLLIYDETARGDVHLPARAHARSTS